ncbi:MAG TPA: hypothetical protein H9674_07290 [Firmicutes bacterium]|nr:hypothetical protein [Bacillota bacterium]
MRRRYQKVQEALPEIKRMLKSRMSQREVAERLGLEDGRPIPSKTQFFLRFFPLRTIWGGSRFGEPAEGISFCAENYRDTPRGLPFTAGKRLSRERCKRDTSAEFLFWGKD